MRSQTSPYRLHPQDFYLAFGFRPPGRHTCSLGGVQADVPPSQTFDRTQQDELVHPKLMKLKEQDGFFFLLFLQSFFFHFLKSQVSSCVF